jgi:phosphotransferase system IIB component
LIPFLVQGKEGIAALGAEAEKLGIVLNSDTIRATEQFKDQLEILGTVVSRNFQQGFLDGFVKQSGNIRDIYSDPIFIQSLQDIGAAFGAIASGILSIVKVYGQAQIVIGSLAAGLAFDVGAIDKDVLDEALKDARSRLAGEGSLSEIPVNIVAKEESASVARQTNQKQELDYVKKRQDAANGILTSLNQEIDLAQIKIDMNGQNAAAIESAIRKQRLYYQLESQGVTLTKEQNENIREKLALLEETQIQLKEIEEQNKLIEQAESDRQQAMTQLAYTFESAFESAITSGKDLGDVINSLIKDIATLILRTQVTAPLMQNLFGTGGGSGGGGLGGIFGSALGSIFGGAGSPGGAPVTTAGALPWLSIPSFATGTDYVTRDTMAMVHRGEAIIPASELNKMNQSSASVNVTQNINVSPGVPELINQKIRESAPIIKQAAMDGVFNEINRGGAAAKTSGRR